MNILMHGCTNGSNFGDYLFADIYFKKLNQINKNGKNMFFEFPRCGLSNFFKNHLNYTYKQKFKDLFNSDMLVYISGGYFGEHKFTIKESIKRLIKYMLIGLFFVIKKRPILVLGIGGGPITSKFLRMIICKILNHCELVTVRDEETAMYFKKYGVKKKIITTSDAAQSITKEFLPTLNYYEKKTIDYFNNNKIIFLHIVKREKIYSNILSALNVFLSSHRDYGIIIGNDYTFDVPIENTKIYNEVICEYKCSYNYNNPWQLCAILNKVDLIVTTKLHVGIIGATFSKSVLSFPTHEKTLRYYKQIGEIERCVPLENVNSDIVKNLLERYHDKKIHLSSKIIEAANENLRLLEEELLKATVNEK